MDMPNRNVLREFTADTSYHCYNRGVEQRDIFLDEQDYGVFLSRIKSMLTDPEELKKELKKKPNKSADKNYRRVRLKSFYGDISLRAYCLMPNHFHLLVHQKSGHALGEFMRVLATSYTMYFNAKYKRVGHLFQGRYKARRVDSAVYGVHISRYIHLNGLNMPGSFERYQYSSMRFLANPENKPSWLASQEVLADFGGNYQKYRMFVAEYADPNSLELLEDKFDLA